jgi:glycosyltransferase involved in cell wall biosynthesis
MRVAIVVNELNIRGGTHKQVQRLAEHLQASGETVTVFTKYFDRNRCYAGLEALDVYAATTRTEYPQGRLFSRIVNVVASFTLALAASRAYDVVNIHDQKLQLFWLFVKLLKPGLKVVWQINDLPPWFRVGTAKDLRTSAIGAFRNHVNRLASRLMARHVDLVTVNVTKNSQRVAECLGVGSLVLHCGVDLRNQEQPNRRDTCGGVLNLISTGVFQPYRNYESILRAQKRLAERFGVDSILRIVGSTTLSPSYAESVARLATELGVQCNILGEVDEKALLQEYTDGDVFLFLNIDQSWGLAVFEAMNCGLPVVVSKSVGAVELLRAGIDSDIVDPWDIDNISNTLHLLHSDAKLYHSRAAAAFRATKDMTWRRLYCEPIRRELRRLSQSQVATRAPLGRSGASDGSSSNVVEDSTWDPDAH